MSAFNTPTVSPAGSGTLVESFGTNRIRITAEQTADRFGMLEVLSQPGEGTPFHIHLREDEFFYVLSGRMSFWCGDEQVDLEAGGCILLPRGVAHRFENTGEEAAHAMVVVTPGAFEGFFEQAAVATPNDPASIEAVASKFGLSFPNPS